MDWITTDSIVPEIWSRLLQYANKDFALEKIVARQSDKSKNGSLQKNAIKQVQQLRSCLLQAKEYFAAATTTSLVTSPNHIYYGMVSLASSCMLMLGDGRKSLDFLRKESANKSHGLHFTTTSRLTNGLTTRMGLLEASFVEVMASGHFRQWYEVLPPDMQVYGKVVRRHMGGSQTTTLDAIGSDLMLDFGSVSRQKKSLLELMLYLPDLYQDLHRYGIASSSARWNIEVEARSGEPTKMIWFIHSAGSFKRLEEILEVFQIESGYTDLLTCQVEGGQTGAIVRFSESPTQSVRLSFPSCRTAMNFDQICYSNNLNTHEFVDIYRIAYGLSMLARYFPDIWVSVLESNCLAERLIERFSRFVIAKAPMLALSLLSGRDTFVTTITRPWT